MQGGLIPVPHHLLKTTVGQQCLCQTSSSMVTHSITTTERTRGKGEGGEGEGEGGIERGGREGERREGGRMGERREGGRGRERERDRERGERGREGGRMGERREGGRGREREREREGEGERGRERHNKSFAVLHTQVLGTSGTHLMSSLVRELLLARASSMVVVWSRRWESAKQRERRWQSSEARN